VNNFLTTLSIPPVNDKTLRKREREIGPVIEAVAKASCQKAAQEELSLTSDAEAGITMSYDMGWQKRGRAMNSLTGVGHAVGIETGKVIAYATRSKRCATCYAAQKRGIKPQQHDCRKNFSKSSKAMEADAVIDVARDLQADGIAIARMVGDDDSSAIKKLREEFGKEIKKSSDINHVKKNLGNRLYDLKGKGHRELSAMVITYIQKCFMYALTQNKNDEDGLRSAFLATVRHMYGDHTMCDRKWCQYIVDPSECWTPSCQIFKARVSKTIQSFQVDWNQM